MYKKLGRIKRASKTRKHIQSLLVNRLTIHKTSMHMYAQIVSEDGKKTLASAATTQNEIKSKIAYTGNKDAAALVGKVIAEKALTLGITKVAFDRSGFKYHGRVKALADAAREAGLQF